MTKAFTVAASPFMAVAVFFAAITLGWMVVFAAPFVFLMRRLGLEDCAGGSLPPLGEQAANQAAYGGRGAITQEEFNQAIMEGIFSSGWGVHRK